MNLTLEESYDRCVQEARAAAGNFYYGFRMLPRDKHRAICAVYAFMRYADDAVDEATSGHASALSEWQAALNAVYDSAAAPTASAVLPALRDTVERFSLPREWFVELLEGVRSDIEPVHFDTDADLDRYCYRVAGVVGLICLRIWGAKDYAAADPLAIQCGAAFQHTNILRDLREDALRGRVYLPASELDRYRVSPSDLSQLVPSPQVLSLVADHAAGTEHLYSRCASLATMISRDARATFLAMYLIYRDLLHHIRRDPGAVFRRRLSLSPLRKLFLAAKALSLARRGASP